MEEQAPSVRGLIRTVDAGGRDALAELWKARETFPPISALGKFEASCAQLFRSIRAAPYTFVATFLTVSLSFSLVAVFFLLATNISQGLVASQQSLAVRLFLNEGTNSAALETLRAALVDHPAVDSVRLIDQGQAFSEFERMLGERSSLLDGLERENPLPQSFELVFREGADIERAAREIKELPIVAERVEFVFFPHEMAAKVSALMNLASTAMWVASLGLLSIVALIIGSAAKLALYAHRDEVEILRLMGASIRRIVTPYLIEGGLQGVLGALIGIFTAYGIYLLLVAQREDAPLLSLMIPELTFLNPMQIVVLLVVGAGLAAGASFIAVRGLASER